jgi:hypothetical protein
LVLRRGGIPVGCVTGAGALDVDVDIGDGVLVLPVVGCGMVVVGGVVNSGI